MVFTQVRLGDLGRVVGGINFHVHYIPGVAAIHQILTAQVTRVMQHAPPLPSGSYGGARPASAYEKVYPLIRRSFYSRCQVDSPAKSAQSAPRSPGVQAGPAEAACRAQPSRADKSRFPTPLARAAGTVATRVELAPLVAAG